MLAGKKLTDYTNLFSPHDLKKKTIIWFCLISKMNKTNSIGGIDKTDLSEQTKFRLHEISKTENILSKKLIKENHAVKN